VIIKLPGITPCRAVAVYKKKGEDAVSTRKKIMVTLIIILLLLTAGVYGYGAYYFTEHFLPGSMVNGFNCSYMTVSESEDLLTKKVGAYVLTIDTRNNGQESITAEQAGLAYDSDGSVGKLIRDQDRFTWFLAFNQHRNYEVSSSIKYDEKKMEAAISGLKCMQQENMTEPSDAHIEEKDDQFVIIPEQQGNALKTKKTNKDIIDALVTGRTPIDLEADGCYKDPKVYQNDKILVKNCELINKLTDVVITYDFDDRTETVDRDTIKNWLTTDENGLYILDQKQIEAYISELAAKYDTVGTERTFNTYDGRGITVGGGNYGWQIDQKEEVKELTRLIKNEETQVREPVYSHKGLVRKTNDIGYTYIEIDLTAQRMVFYKDGTPIADAQIVSGNPFVPNCATPAGCYTTGEIKSGYTVNGEDYPSAVNYWIPFDENLGINDAPWRTAFGEQLYEFEGTHGSICAPADQMQIIYNNVEKNTPVVIYE
jgi:vancomycin resistance protein YoaR